LHGARGQVEGGHAFGSVERADAPAGARANVDEAPASAEGGTDQVNGACDLRQCAPDRGSYRRVFSVDEAGDLDRRFLVEVSGAVVRLLGAQATNVMRRLGFASFQSLTPFNLTGNEPLSDHSVSRRVVEWYAPYGLATPVRRESFG
jgi:hypothetical protein